MHGKSFHNWPIVAQVALAWPVFMACWAALIWVILFSAKQFRRR